MTTYRFITVVPEGKMSREESVLLIKDVESLELMMATLNGHVPYTWWRIYGDTFHPKPCEMTTVAMPDKWLEDEAVKREACRIGRFLVDPITPENIGEITTGTNSTKQDSLNFHECVPDVIAQIDALYLDALGLPPNELMDQMQTMRSDSSWRLGTDF